MIDYPPPGFAGLAHDKPVVIHRRHLPHWRQDGATYFVTFRMADSLPQKKLDQLRDERELWQRNCPDPSDEEVELHCRQVIKKIEIWLDQGHGECILERDDLAEIVEGRLRHFAGQRYDLFSFVVMPNHVHAVVRPGEEHCLDSIMQGWKGVSANRINRALARSGTCWQEEGFDRIVRDSAHLRRVVRYIEKNPGKARAKARCWTTAAWDEWLGRAAE